MWLDNLTFNFPQLSKSDFRAKCEGFYPRMTGKLFEVPPLAKSSNHFCMFFLNIL